MRHLAPVPAAVVYHARANAYTETMLAAAEHNGGGLIADVPRSVHDCADHEDNLILDLAAEVG